MFTAQLESAGPEGYSNSSTQVDIPLDGAIAGWAARHLEGRVDELVGGVERRPHVTILYGLTSPKVEEVLRIGRSHGGPVRLRIGELDYFDAPHSDVLYAKVHSDDLHSLHRKLAKLPNVNKFTYKPHMTIAYLKKGEGRQFKGLKEFEGEHALPGFWLNLAKNQGGIFVPTAAAFVRSPFNEDLMNTLDDLTESVGRRRPKRQMRLVYLRRDPQGVPQARNPVDAAIDELIADVHQVFDWSVVYSGDRQQARIAAMDLYNDVMNLARVKIADEAAKEDGLRFTLGDVQRRWSELIRFMQRSSELALRAIRRRVRV